MHAIGRGDDNEFWWYWCNCIGWRKSWCVESSDLELQHLTQGCGGRVGLFVLRKLFNLQWV